MLEALGRFEEAIADYRAVITAAPGDPAAWNNLGNATAGALGGWEMPLPVSWVGGKCHCWWVDGCGLPAVCMQRV